MRACELLTAPSPECLAGSAVLLEEAVRQLRSARISAGNPSAHAEIRHLRASIGQAARLLQNAAEYHGGWNRWLGARIGGYGANGEPAGILRSAVVCLNG
jgi:hypothetical protein